MANITLLPCRKCGSTDVTWWQGCGTQADLTCNECGQYEGLQVCDLFAPGDDRRHYPLEPPHYRYSQDIINLANDRLVEEWNIRYVKS